MKLSSKLILTALLGISSLVTLFYFKSTSYKYYNQRNLIELGFKELDSAQKKLDHSILTNAFFLYTNQDEIINAIEQVHYHLNILVYNPHFQKSYPNTISVLLDYQKAYETKINTIYDFQTANTVIKNSTAALPLLQTKLIDSNEHLTSSQRAGIQKITQISGTLLVAKNAMDTQLIISMKNQIGSLKALSFPDPQQQEAAQKLISHFNVIVNAFPDYSYTLRQINDPALNTLLDQTKKSFDTESMQKLKSVNYFSWFLIILFIGSIALITFFLILSEYTSRVDKLTGLKNRKAYEERIKHAKEDLALILINIQKFKHYNDFYGVVAGDQLLIATAKHIQALPFEGEKPTYYRLGADDFGILYQCLSHTSIETLTNDLLTAFSDSSIIIDGEIRTPSIVVAASTTKPLLETADMALKSKAHINPIIYNESLNLRQVTHDNITKVQELKLALEEKKVIPYFHPIVDLASGKVTKHEVLARVVIAPEQIRSIFPYLNVAKETNLYPKITHTIIEQSFPIIADNTGDFSINLSIEDISNSKTVTMIETKLEEYSLIGKRIIFEILESEAIEEYAEIVEFIKKMRRYGCRIAIDDFGSGYSNFSHILNLTIDIIKIDGSLIRNLDTDEKAKTIIQTIINFTKSASIHTVAEFVHNKEIAITVTELGVDSAQGFYFYEPLPNPLDIAL